MKNTKNDHPGIFRPNHGIPHAVRVQMEFTRKETPILLNHVKNGDRNEVEKMLSKDIGLLILRGDVTDEVGRTFTQVSPLEYMKYLADTRMLKMALSYAPALTHTTDRGLNIEGVNFHAEANFQITQFEKNGKLEFESKHVIRAGSNIPSMISEMKEIIAKGKNDSDDDDAAARPSSPGLD